MRVLVSRGTGDKLAPEVIFDSLCTTQNVGVERGRCYLYDEGFIKEIYTISLPYRVPIYPGYLLAIHHGAVGESFVARVVAHEIHIGTENDARVINSTITVERSIEIE